MNQTLLNFKPKNTFSYKEIESNRTKFALLIHFLLRCHLTEIESYFETRDNFAMMMIFALTQSCQSFKLHRWCLLTESVSFPVIVLFLSLTSLSMLSKINRNQIISARSFGVDTGILLFCFDLFANLFDGYANEKKARTKRGTSWNDDA